MSPESHELHQICVCGRTSERRKRRKLKRLSSKRIKLNGHRLPVMISSIVSETRLKLRGRLTVKMKQANSTSINERLPVILNLIALSSFLCFTLNSATIQTQALHITNFRVPPFVPITLQTIQSSNGIGSNGSHLLQQQQQDLTKPILFDCDYDYQPEKDERLSIRWFKNKESEPFYQWLPELGSRYFADWIKPLVNMTFVSDPHDPMKRYRSLLIRRLSMNLTGAYTCVVSSFDGQDSRQSSLVMYQPPKQFTFEHKIYPPPPQSSMMLMGPPAQSAFNVVAQQHQLTFTPPTPLQSRLRTDPLVAGPQLGGPAGTSQHQQYQANQKASPTQFKGYASNAAVVRPPNNGIVMGNTMAPPTLLTSSANGYTNNNSNNDLGADSGLSNTKVVYTHDGRPITRRPATGRRRRRRQVVSESSVHPIANWILAQRQASISSSSSSGSVSGKSKQQAKKMDSLRPKHMIQLHHFTCHASQVTPRPVMMLLVKRDSESIAQYLHESSTVHVRPYQVNMLDYYGENQLGTSAGSESGSMITLFDVTLSATVALNVSLEAPSSMMTPVLGGGGPLAGVGPRSSQPNPMTTSLLPPPPPPNYLTSSSSANTVLTYKRNQRMSFECHLEITGTEFESRKRININEEEVYQLAEQEVAKRRKLAAAQRQWEQHQRLANQQLGQQQVTSWNLEEDAAGYSESENSGDGQDDEDIGSQPQSSSAVSLVAFSVPIWTYSVPLGIVTGGLTRGYPVQIATMASLLARGSAAMMLMRLRRMLLV